MKKILFSLPFVAFASLALHSCTTNGDAIASSQNASDPSSFLIATPSDEAVTGQLYTELQQPWNSMMDNHVEYPSSSSSDASSSSAAADTIQACNFSSLGFCVDSVNITECEDQLGESLDECPKGSKSQCTSNEDSTVTIYLYQNADSSVQDFCAP